MSAPSAVQSTRNSQFSVQAVSATFGSNVTSGNIVVAVGASLPATGLSILGGGISWNVDPGVNGATLGTGMVVSTGPLTVVLSSSFPSAGGALSLHIVEIGNTAGIDQRAAISGAGFITASATIPGQPITPSQTGTLALGLFVCTDGNSKDFTAGAGWTQVITGAFGNLIESLVLTSAATISPTASYDSSNTMAVATVSFLQISTGGTQYTRSVSESFSFVDALTRAAAFLLPSSDARIGNWTDEASGTTNIYTHISELTPVDTDYVRSPLGPNSEVYVTKLSSATDPASSRSHLVHFRYAKDSPGTQKINLTVELRQGYVNEGALGTLIATPATLSDIGAGISGWDYRLSNVEADSITDYANLYLRFIASKV